MRINQGTRIGYPVTRLILTTRSKAAGSPRQANECGPASANQPNPGQSAIEASCVDGASSARASGAGASLSNILGVADPDFIRGLVKQLTGASARGSAGFDTELFLLWR